MHKLYAPLVEALEALLDDSVTLNQHEENWRKANKALAEFKKAQ